MAHLPKKTGEHALNFRMVPQVLLILKSRFNLKHIQLILKLVKCYIFIVTFYLL